MNHFIDYKNKLEILHQYYYSRSKVIAKAVVYILLSVLLVALGIFCFNHWDLSFMFSDWKGYLMIIPYGLVTLGTIISTFDKFIKIGKVKKQIPALVVATDRFVVYDKAGLPNNVMFEDCNKVRIKRSYQYRGAPPTLTLHIYYHNKEEQIGTTEHIEINLGELDKPQNLIDKQLNKVYKKYKKE